MIFKRKALALAVIVATSTLTACGGSSSSTPTPTPTPTNSAPTDIALSVSAVNENVAGAVIGTLSATDADSADTFTYVVDNELFVVEGSELKLAAETALNFEMQESVTVNVTVTDSANATFTKELTVAVTDMLDTYKFISKIETDESSVGYSGQTARHALIAELTNYIGSEVGLKADIEANEFADKAAVIEKLNSYFRTTDVQYSNNFELTFMAEAKQAYITDISPSHKNLVGKIAGNDASRMRKEWTNGATFIGAGAGMTPETLVDAYFSQLADNAVDANIRLDEATNNPITKVYVNTDGTDLKQLIQKFLLMSITYSQGTDDYLDEGLAADNTVARGDGKADTALEHGYDEGFGYFGAARDYLEYNDNEIAGKVSSDEDGRDTWNGKHDTNGDGTYDLTSEVNLGNSVNAAKRDRGSKSNANPTDYTKDAMEAFLAGRKMINDNVGNTFTADEMVALEAQRDIAVGAWEKAVAATVIHYINDVSADLDKSGTDDYDYEDVAKHWSEMKGFALGLQFNPHSPISDEKFAELQSLLGQKPVTMVFGSTDKTAVTAYIDDLASASAILATALELDAENVANW